MLTLSTILPDPGNKTGSFINYVINKNYCGHQGTEVFLWYFSVYFFIFLLIDSSGELGYQLLKLFQGLNASIMFITGLLECL